MTAKHTLFTSEHNTHLEPFNPMDMTGRTVLVTGASSGIGQSLAILLSRVGARVVISGRDHDRLNHTLQLMSGSGHLGSVFDLAQPENISDWLQAICSDIGPLAGVAHCAGMIGTRPLKAVSLEFIQHVIQVNLVSCMMMAQAFRLKTCHQPNSSLVFIASTAALKSAPGNSIYAASKGGIIALTKSLGLELLRDGMRVNCVAPAMVDTPMSEHFKNTVTDTNFQKVIDMHPLGLGHPDDVAGAIVYLLADTGRWITGSTLCVDGGFLS